MEDAGHKVSVPFTFDSKIIETALHRIQSRQLNPRKEIDPGLFAEVDRIMESAVETGYTAPAGSFDFREQIRNNTEVFAAFKAHRMGRDMAAQLLDKNGQMKSFRQFKKDTEGIVSHHVDRWLRTEYDTAVKRAHKAAEMQQFRDEADVFPNIEWLPSTAVNPREEHMPFYHHIWPIDDPFWEHHKPGDEWGCQCDWRATDEAVTDNTGLDGDGGPSVSKGLGGDPSKTGQLFTNDHPYFPSDCKHCGFYKPNVRNILRGIITARVKDCYNCPYVQGCIEDAKEKGYLPDAVYGDRLLVSPSADKTELEENIRVAKALLESFPDMQIKISEHVIKKGHKNPEYIINGLVADRKGIKSEQGITWGFKSAIQQGCACVVIDLDQRMSNYPLHPATIAKYISWRYRDFISGVIAECYVVYNGKAVCIDGSFTSRDLIIDEIKKLKP